MRDIHEFLLQIESENVDFEPTQCTCLISAAEELRMEKILESHSPSMAMLAKVSVIAYFRTVSCSMLSISGLSHYVLNSLNLAALIWPVRGCVDCDSDEKKGHWCKGSHVCAQA